MARNGFGKQDKDRVGKEKTDRPLRSVGADPGLSAMVGGVSNRSSGSATKGGSKKGGKAFPFGKSKGR